MAVLLALALLLGAAQSALASVGDTTIYYGMPEDGMSYYSVDTCMLAGNQVLYVIGSKLCVYDIASRQTTEYDASELVNMNPDMPETETGDGDEDEFETYIDSYRETVAWFAYQDELYAVVNVSTFGEDSRSMEGGFVYRLELADGSARLVESDLPRLDWSGMIESYGDYMYSRYAQNAFASGSRLYAQTYDDDGNNVIEVFDLTTGRADEHYVQDLYQMAPAGDGKILTFQYNWSEETGHIGLYDPASESLEIKADYEIDTITYNLPRNLYYLAEKDTLYYVLSGEIWAAQGFDFAGAVAVNDCPVDSSNGVAQMTEDGFLLLYDWQTIVLRNTDPAKRSEITLYVKDYNYASAIDRAYYDYTNLHGDISVVVSRGGRVTDILQAMMNRDSGVDVYAMDMSLSAYNAVFERGFMAELDSSAKLTEKIDSMYPVISETLKKDGHLYAVPVSAYGYAMGVNPEALDKLGWTMDDMPKTWDAFFDFLAELPARLEGSEVRAFESWYDQRDLRMQLFSSVLQSYQNYINAGEAEYAFNTPLLKGLMKRVDEMDMASLDVNESNYNEEDDTWYDNWDGRTALFTSSVSTVMQGYYGGEPLLFSFGEEPPRVPFYLRVLFVNPFSRHVPESIEFLETVLDCLEQPEQYTFYPDCDEPVRYPDFEEYKKNLAEWLETAKKEMEAADEDEKEMYEEQVGYLEEELANIDDTYWMFSPKSIAAYKARAQYLAPVTYDFTNEISGSEDDNFYDLIQRYYEGMIDVEELLSTIDKKVQMMRLEDM